MFGIGMPEMILILAVALIVIGPKKLPDLAKSLGKAMGEFKKATSDLKESMQIDSELKDLKNTFNDLEQEDRKSTGKTATSADTELPKGDDTVKKPDDGTIPGETEDPLASVQKAYHRGASDPSDSGGVDPVAENDPETADKSDPDSGADAKTEQPKDV